MVTGRGFCAKGCKSPILSHLRRKCLDVTTGAPNHAVKLALESGGKARISPQPSERSLNLSLAQPLTAWDVALENFEVLILLVLLVAGKDMKQA